MYTYKLMIIRGTEPSCVIRTTDGACIPFDPANTDYQTFKKDIAEGKPLQDADGNEMSAEAAQEYVATLP